MRRVWRPALIIVVGLAGIVAGACGDDPTSGRVDSGPEGENRGRQGPPAHNELRPGRCIDCHRIHGPPGLE